MASEDGRFRQRMETVACCLQLRCVCERVWAGGIGTGVSIAQNLRECLDVKRLDLLMRV